MSKDSDDLELDDVDDPLLDAGLDFAHRQIEGQDYPFGVAEPISNVVLICWAQSHIDNGGLNYFFEMEAPGAPPFPAFCSAYREIGAMASAACIEAAVEFFAFEDVHLDADLRREALYPANEDYETCSQRFDALDNRIYEDDVWKKMSAYIARHKTIFLS